MIVSEPVIVAPQMRTAAAPVTVTGPVIRPPWTSSPPPGLTMTGPVWLPPAPMHAAWPAAAVSGPARVPVTHGLV